MARFSRKKVMSIIKETKLNFVEIMEKIKRFRDLSFSEIVLSEIH